MGLLLSWIGLGSILSFRIVLFTWPLRIFRDLLPALGRGIFDRGFDFHSIACVLPW